MTKVQEFLKELTLVPEEEREEKATAELKKLKEAGDRESFNELYDALFGETEAIII